MDQVGSGCRGEARAQSQPGSSAAPERRPSQKGRLHPPLSPLTVTGSDSDDLPVPQASW